MLSSPSTEEKPFLSFNSLLFVGKNTSLMDRAFQIAKKADLKVSWTTNITDKTQVYVCERIMSNPILENVCRDICILGPCFIIQICEDKLPKKLQKGIRRISNVLAHAVICFTSIPHKQRAVFKEKVQLMGGIASGDFHEGITHLVAAEAGSRKFIVASYLNKPIMKFEWLTKLWNDCHSNPTINVNDYDKYACQLFEGLTVCVSGYSSDIRDEVKRKVEELGGNFSGSMQQATCTHLIVNQPSGQKYEYAVRWKIPIVNIDWLNDCYEKRHARDENQYKVEEETTDNQKTSTPNTSSNNIPGPEVSMVSNVSSVHDTVLDLTTFKAGDYLDGCVILLHGFNAETLINLKKLINVCGAGRVNIFSDSVTHVVVGNASDAKDFENKNVIIVNQQWLIDCAKERKLLSTFEYTFGNKNNSLNRSVTRNSGEKMKVTPLETTGVHGENIENADLYSQYLGDSTMEKVGALLDQENLIREDKATLVEEPEGQTNEVSGESNNQKETEATMESSQPDTQLFLGIRFQIHEGLEEKDMFCDILQQYNGIIVEKNPDYYIVPNKGNYRKTVGKVVTETWVRLCFEKNALVKPNFICKPIPPDAGEPLKGCVICFSNFSGEERQGLHQLATALGAHVQEQFCRKNGKGLEETTHLILEEPDGKKFNAARKWGKFALSASWLKACFHSLKKAPEEDYDIERFEETESSTDEEDNGVKIEDSEELDQDLQTRPDYIDSPSIFLNPEVNFRPRLRINKEILKSTPNERKRSRPEPDTDLLSECSKGVETALKNSKERASPRGLTPAIKRKRISPLDNVIIGVSTKLADKQTKLNEQAEKLGAEYRWDVNDLNITHLVCDKILKNELDEETKRGRAVVTAKWLESCAECNKRLNEANFMPKVLRKNSAEDEKIESDIQALMELDDNRMNHENSRKGSGSFCGLASLVQTQHTESQSQRGDVRWHDEPLNLQDTIPMEKKFFILSGFPENEKEEISEKIICFKNCEIINGNGFDDSCTHMICKTLIRNEKILSAIASGKWILKPEYVTESYEENVWLPEESFEWANSFDLTQTSSNSQAEQLARWSRHWRIQIKAGESLPFQSWTVGIVANKDKVEGFRKILSSGGATIVFLKESTKRVSHCFVDGSKKNDKRLTKILRAENILRTDYIVSYLMGNTSTDNFRIPP